MAYTQLSAKSVGSTIKLKESGTLVDYIIVHQGRPSTLYDSSCDGTWVLRKNIYESRQWHSSNVNQYASSDIHSYLNSTFLARFDSDIQSAIIQAKIPYGAGNSKSTVYSGTNGLSSKVFLLSGYEVGWTTSTNSSIPVDGAALSYFASMAATDSARIGYLNGTATGWWLRSPRTDSSTFAWRVYTSGSIINTECSYTFGIRPALILPSSLLVADDGTVTTNTAPSTPSGITIPDSISGGTTITVSWGASTDAEGNLEGYIVERSVNGGSTWTQIYQGSALSTTNSVAFGTESVMYRVKAYDTAGAESAYKTSGQITVTNNNAPTAPASITVPLTINGGSNLLISWGIATDVDDNLSGYCLERSIDGGTFELIYTGGTGVLAYTDAITKGWTSVTYRVRAFDTYDAYSPYTTSQTRAVNNNTPPVITCGSASGTNLGTKDSGFTIPYSVNDADGDTVTVTETLDGVVKRTYTATLGGNNTFTVTGDYFMRILNGSHTLAITASDGVEAVTHTLTFTKLVTFASIALEQAFPADALVTACAMAVTASLPADANFSVEVTNNPFDTSPVWEDCTAAVKSMTNHVFKNTTALKGFGFGFRVTASRGPSNKGGHTSCISGGFQ